MKFILKTIFVFGVFSSVFCQVEKRHSFSIELGLPQPLYNKAFRVMKGVVAIAPYYQYRLSNSLAFGAGVNFHYFQINKFKMPDSQQAKGGMYSGGAFFKVSHEKFHTDQFATDFGVKVGYSQSYFVTDYNESKIGGPVIVGSATVQPMLGLILAVDEFTSYRFTFGYTIQGFGYSPQRLGVTTNSSYLNGGTFDVSTYTKPTQYFIFGFGFTHYFSKNKNTEE